MSQESIHESKIDKWIISWESCGEYRLWCKQEHPDNTRLAAVVMFNPGSLKGDGARLRQDTTLRILREIFTDTGYNPFIVNLFTLSTPKPRELFDDWSRRDCPSFSCASLAWSECSAVLFAYGAYEFEQGYSELIKERIRELRDRLSKTPEIIVPLAKTRTPKHPMRIQIEKLKCEFQKRIADHAAANY